MFNIWSYVSFLGGVVLIVLLLVILFEIITAFISNRRKQAIQENLLADAEELFKEGMEKKIREEIDNLFKE